MTYYYFCTNIYFNERPYLNYIILAPLLNTYLIYVLLDELKKIKCVEFKLLNLFDNKVLIRSIVEYFSTVLLKGTIEYLYTWLLFMELMWN